MENIFQSLRINFTGFSVDENMWIVESFIVVFVTVTVAFTFHSLLKKLKKKTLLTKSLWDDALVDSLHKPAKSLIWVFGLSSAATIAGKHSSSVILQSIDSIRYLGVIIIGTWFLTSFISRAEKNFMSPEYCKKPMDHTTASAIGKLLRISVFITAVLIVLQYFDVEISGILAFGGIGGIAVGFAAKDLLANFFGGLMIYLDRPFAVGDWIRSHDKEIEGVVEDIGWRLTRIRTFDKRPLYVPNATFTQIAVENPSRMTNRRIYETIGIRYDDALKMETILNDVESMLKEHEDIADNMMIMVNFNTFASSSLDFFIYCFTKTTDWATFHKIKQDVLIKILNIIEAHGAECAFPTSTVHVPESLKLAGDANTRS